MAAFKSTIRIAAMSKRAVFVTLSLFCTLLGIEGSSQAAGDANAGKARAIMCTGCHTGSGMRINRPEIYRIPKIAGQNPEYLANALRAYKSGERKNENMHAVAAPLNDQDIQDLAAHFSGLRWH
jgi:cytochrome c553